MSRTMAAIIARGPILSPGALSSPAGHGCCYIMVNFADISDERGALRLLPAWMSGAFALARPPAPLATAPTTCSAAAQAHKQCQLPQS